MSEFFYVAPCDVSEHKLTVSGEEARHIARVLRHKKGDKVVFTDGTGVEYECFLLAVSDRAVTAQINTHRRRTNEPIKRVTLAQAVPKGQRMDFVVEKGTELGLYAIIPLVTERSVVRGPDDRSPLPLPGFEDDPEGHKLERWKRIAIAAMKQSLRSWLPEIAPFCDFAAMMKKADDYDLILMADEGEKKHSLKEAVRSTKHELRKVLCLVGPEGGFSDKEKELSREKKAQVISLGPRRLRSESAGILLTALTLHELGELE
ncbi:MAG: 16S rRNA (uracil(1498)-N(3))-methyltransferase [Candidatus Edwardsbacteria bacterium]|nr:16S rRNA (uracil(1498)-N(3))-methyltransferase [Candidatus Edwardsbacteria bacterium]